MENCAGRHAAQAVSTAFVVPRLQAAPNGRSLRRFDEELAGLAARQHEVRTHQRLLPVLPLGHPPPGDEFGARYAEMRNAAASE